MEWKHLIIGSLLGSRTSLNQTGASNTPAPSKKPPLTSRRRLETQRLVKDAGPAGVIGNGKKISPGPALGAKVLGESSSPENKSPAPEKKSAARKSGRSVAGRHFESRSSFPRNSITP